MSALREFVLTEDHVKLLRSAYIRWDGCEFGAPGIDPKRPYGNSAVVEDIAAILHPEYAHMREGEALDWLEDNMSRLEQTHQETLYALQILLVTGGLELGRYVQRDRYNSRSWARVVEAVSE